MQTFQQRTFNKAKRFYFTNKDFEPGNALFTITDLDRPMTACLVAAYDGMYGIGITPAKNTAEKCNPL